MMPAVLGTPPPRVGLLDRLGNVNFSWNHVLRREDDREPSRERGILVRQGANVAGGRILRLALHKNIRHMCSFFFFLPFLEKKKTKIPSLSCRCAHTHTLRRHQPEATGISTIKRENKRDQPITGITGRGKTTQEWKGNDR